MEACSGKRTGRGVKGSKAGAKIHGAEAGAKTCGAEVPATSRHAGLTLEAALETYP